jgi:hypothetical protein
MWILVLNDMRSAQIEMTKPVAVAESRDALESFIENEAESWRDGQWRKSFRKGSPLEWFNPPFFGGEAFQDIGTKEDWQREAGERFDNLVNGLVRAPGGEDGK